MYIGKNNKIHTSEQLFFKFNKDITKIPDDSITNTGATKNETYWTSSKISCELLSRGFSEASLKAAIPFTFSLSASLNHDEAKGNFKESTKDFLYAEHFFPKGNVALSRFREEINPEANNFFNVNPITLKNVEKFFRRFGEFVPTRFTLGGKLYKYEKLEISQSGSNKKSSTEMEIEAKARARQWFSEAGLGITNSYEKESQSSEIKGLQSLGISVVGGEKAQLNNLSGWIKSLENPLTWQIITMDSLRSTLSFLDPNIQKKIKKLMKEQVKEIQEEEMIKRMKQTDNERRFDIVIEVLEAASKVPLLLKPLILMHGIYNLNQENQKEKNRLK